MYAQIYQKALCDKHISRDCWDIWQHAIGLLTKRDRTAEASADMRLLPWPRSIVVTTSFRHAPSAYGVPEHSSPNSKHGSA